MMESIIESLRLGKNLIESTEDLAYLKEHLRLRPYLSFYYLKIICPTQLLGDKYWAELGTVHGIASICIVYREDKGFFNRKKTKSKKSWSQEELLMDEIFELFGLLLTESCLLLLLLEQYYS